ncbi:MAG TPA: hypothetical protein VG992_01145 [Candidatus Saccharimonadales bacterium]|nr:hypothetical protein [Candidatus Saccharimonadales bacterium]
MATVPQHQSPRRVQQLVRQYPFLEEVLRFERHRSNGGEIRPVIRVKRGDADLLFQRADNIDGRRSYTWTTEDRSLKGSRFEYYRPVSRTGETGGIRDWRAVREGGHDHYVRDLFTHDFRDWGSTSSLGEDAFEVVGSIVWVTREEWYPESAEVGRDEPVARDITITLYQEPRDGWRRLYATADPLVNVNLYGSMLFPGFNPNDPFMRVIYDRLVRLGMEFQERVWKTGLGPVIIESPARGMSSDMGGIKVMSYILAGRMLIQFEQGNASFTMKGEDELDKPRIGFGSIDGTVAQAERMVRKAIEFWESADEATRLTLHTRNDNINMGF